MKPSAPHTGASPQVVAGSLARVRADAPSKFRGRTGLVVAVQGATAVLRFGAVRTHVFAISDLDPVIAFATGRQW